MNKDITITVKNVSTELLQLQLYVLDRIQDNKTLSTTEKDVIEGICNLLSEILRESKND